MLVTSIFSFFPNFFQKPPSLGSLIVGIVRKELITLRILAAFVKNVRNG